MFAKNRKSPFLAPLLSVGSEFQFGKLNAFRPIHNIEVGDRGDSFFFFSFAKILSGLSSKK